MFRIEKEIPNFLGRAGVLETLHGPIKTPAFVTVGTKGTVKSLTPEQMVDLGAQVVLANTYHLYLEPGEKNVKLMGGLGQMMNWSGPTMTDSGGFQAFSLGVAYEYGIGKFISSEAPPVEVVEAAYDTARKNKKAKITEDGVEFQSVIDGSKHFLSPEKSIQIQQDIGADIIFALDECTSPHGGYDYLKEAMERTHRWAERSLGEHRQNNPTLTLPKGEGTERGIFLYHTTDQKTWRSLQERVLEMRSNPTPSENLLWQFLKNNSTSFHFRRQHIIGNYIVDFVCLEKSLVVEVDGDIHDYRKTEDAERTEFLKGKGFSVIRFKNADVIENSQRVFNEIVSVLKSLPFGEGRDGVRGEVFPQSLFGIVQGGRYRDLREESARVISAMDFDGFGIGGSFVKEDMHEAVSWVNAILPKAKPRHLLGVGEPLDLFGAVENGCDLFDCVAPTRTARNGTLYTRFGKINILNSKFKTDLSPIDEGCTCYTCQNYTRSYVSHLFRAKEMLAATLASIHNLHFIISMVDKMREAILGGNFFDYKQNFLDKYYPQ